MFERVNSVASKICPTSHLFFFKMDSLNMLGRRMFFPFLVLGQTYGSNAYRHG
jgi:hypothetical protein